MLKEVVMLSSILLLVYLGTNIMRTASRKGRLDLLKLSLFFMFLATSITFYFLRDVFLMEENLDIALYKLGAGFQITSFLMIYLFAVDTLYSKKIRKIFYITGIAAAFSAALLMLFSTLKRELTIVVLDKPYTVSMIRFPVEAELHSMAFLSFVVFLFPFLSFFLYGLKNPKKRLKSFLYASGIGIAVLGTVTCYTVSPILARILYSSGALICYYAYTKRWKE